MANNNKSLGNKEHLYDDTGKHNLDKASSKLDYIMKFINNMCKDAYEQKAKYDKSSCEAAYWEGYKTGLKDLQTNTMKQWEDA